MSPKRGCVIERLSARHRDVLALLAQGRSNAEIATALGVGEQTVRTHLHTIYERLGLWDDHTNQDGKRVRAAVLWDRCQAHHEED